MDTRLVRTVGTSTGIFDQAVSVAGDLLETVPNYKLCVPTSLWGPVGPCTGRSIRPTWFYRLVRWEFIFSGPPRF